MLSVFISVHQVGYYALVSLYYTPKISKTIPSCDVSFANGELYQECWCHVTMITDKLIRKHH